MEDKLSKEFKGEDSENGLIEYQSISELYPDKSQWYNHSKEYWEKQESTINGMLGGFEQLHDDDIQESFEFLKKIFDGKSNGVMSVIDCGAGIGRVSNDLLYPFVKHSHGKNTGASEIKQKSKNHIAGKGNITKEEDDDDDDGKVIVIDMDLVDVSNKFLEQAKDMLTKNKEQGLKLDIHCHSCGMQEIDLQKHCNNRLYDLIWCQWVIIYLTDEDLVDFLKRCKQGLRKDGKSYIVIKDNVITNSNSFIGDQQDSSVTRSEEHLKFLFKKADVQIIAEERQKKFPPGLFPVKMYALQ